MLGGFEPDRVGDVQPVLEDAAARIEAGIVGDLVLAVQTHQRAAAAL
jgi:hypothetical protein